MLLLRNLFIYLYIYCTLKNPAGHYIKGGGGQRKKVNRNKAFTIHYYQYSYTKMKQKTKKKACSRNSLILSASNWHGPAITCVRVAICQVYSAAAVRNFCISFCKSCLGNCHHTGCACSGKRYLTCWHALELAPAKASGSLYNIVVT